MKILVTGANGYIGKHVVESLLALGHEVIALDITTDRIDERAQKINANIFEADNLPIPDVLIHLAWQDGFAHNNPSHLNNLPRHFNFLKGFIDRGLKHLVVMGSMHEVGYFEGAIDENTQTNPISLYGIAKNSLRQALEVYLKDKEVIFQWLRGFYVVGDDYSNHSIFTKILEMEKEGKDFFPFTDGKNKYDFEDIKILSTQIAKASTQNEVTGIINCCSGVPVSIKDKVEEFLKKNNLKIKPEYGKFVSRSYDSPIIYGDNSKIEKIWSKN